MNRRCFTLAVLAAFLIVPGFLPGQTVPSRTMTPVYSAKARAFDSATSMKVPLLPFPEQLRSRQIPAAIDNSRKTWWAGIQDQYLFYSCQQYSGVEYVFGYEINRLRNKSGAANENIYPAHYTWNFLNQGERYVGVNFLHSFDLIRDQGHMTCDDYGFDTSTSVLGWISGYEKYYHAMSNRLKHVYAIEVDNPDGINTLRNYLYDHLDGSSSGGMACFTTSSGTLYNMPVIPSGTPEGGKHVILEWQPDPVHGLAVVGYNDSIRFDINHDGKYTRDLDITGDGIVDARDWETGAFKIANSYGWWWSDTGYVYAMYRSFAFPYGQGGLWNNRVYVVEADSAYHPLLTAKVSIDYNNRNKIRVLAGVSTDTLDQMPARVIDFPIFNFQGGEHAMTGNDSVPEGRMLECGLDLTPLLNFVPPGQEARCFIMVEERDPDHIGHGAIGEVSFISHFGGEHQVAVNGADFPVRDNNTTVVSAVMTLPKPDVHVVTSTLPPFQNGQPVQAQLEATGGRPPYDWTLSENYTTKPVTTPEPSVGGTSLYVHHETCSFARVALPFQFPFYDKLYDSVYINYYGFIAFEPQNLPAPYVVDESAMLRMFPVISPSFSQQYVCQVNNGDGIWFEGDASRAVVRWKLSVTPYYTSSTNDFATILHSDGRIEFCYGTMDNQGFTHTFYRGLSKGDKVNSDVNRQWDANDLSGKSFIYYPPVTPQGLNLDRSGVLTVTAADTTNIYEIGVCASDQGRISGSRRLILSGGLDIAHELVCGANAMLQKGEQASLKLTLTNRTENSLTNLVLKLQCSDSVILVEDSALYVSSVNPGQSLVVPSAFRFRLVQSSPEGYSAIFTLSAVSTTINCKKMLQFPVVAPNLVMETPFVDDGYNERLDPGEVADLVVSLSNKGGLAARNVRLVLAPQSPLVSVLSNPEITTDSLGVSSSHEYRFRIQASREAVPGIEIPVRLTLSDVSGVVRILDFSLPVGTRPVAVVSLSSSQSSARAMEKALDSLHVGYDSIFSLPFAYNRYASIFLVLGTANSGSYVLSESESAGLAGYLQQGGNLYLESYYMWYYQNETVLPAMFNYTSKRVPAYFFAEVKGLSGTFTDSMRYVNTSPLNYAIFSLEPANPGYPTLVNTGNPARNLEIAYHGDDYRTIGTMIGFSSLEGVQEPASHTTLMKRYLEFFDINVSGPYPLFHTASTTVCVGKQVSFTDDSFDNITTRTWEFEGGTPAVSTDPNPVVSYPNPGVYDVKLTVSNGLHTRSILKTNYMHAGVCSGMTEKPEETVCRLFPNPVGDEATIVFNQQITGTCSISIVDLLGNKVTEVVGEIRPDRTVTVDLRGLSASVYFIVTKASEYSGTLKLVKK